VSEDELRAVAAGIARSLWAMLDGPRHVRPPDDWGPVGHGVTFAHTEVIIKTY